MGQYYFTINFVLVWNVNRLLTPPPPTSFQRAPPPPPPPLPTGRGALGRRNGWHFRLTLFLINEILLIIAESLIPARSLSHEIHLVEGACHAKRGLVCWVRNSNEGSEEEVWRYQSSYYCTLQVCKITCFWGGLSLTLYLFQLFFRSNKAVYNWASSKSK